MNIGEYIQNIGKRYALGNATEHTFRGDLQQLIESMVPGVAATNEAKRQACGAPDYILSKGEIPVGYIEAKDIGDPDLKGEKKAGNKEQFDRYRASLNNLIFTDYLDFHLYLDGVATTSIRIGKVENGKIIGLPENYAFFENFLKGFCANVGSTIRSSKKLAEMMAGKARMLAEVIKNALESDEETHANSTLKDQLTGFKDILIHDIKPKEFADIYAQTIAYGMFAARLHDPTLPTFNRQEAAELIPKTNPFLRKLFGYIAGPDIDDRILWIVEALAEIFRFTDVASLLADFGKDTQTQDPIIHFYETFLAEYDPALRKARGVWYTPAPVVNFIVRAVDDILKTEFGLEMGLADTSKVKIKLDTQNFDKKTGKYKVEEKEVHKVQILDPATGTGTFLAEVVRHVHKSFEGQAGIWSTYVENHLIPRLNGFELLMASYAMAHLKLDLLLKETGYKPSFQGLGQKRFNIFLTNSLEESHPDTGTLFANWLSAEANEANRIKRDTPVMVVMGNPPYSVSSSNKSEWIEKLVGDYKKDLNEKNIQPLSDDYIKFIRFGQHFIEKNGEGILAYISNNSFLDGLIHRQMRKSLLETFDKIYILDLHGNAKKKETAADGSVDQNVFDIMQGVSINILVKKGLKSSLSEIYNWNVFGKRESKYNFLYENTLKSIGWTEPKLRAPHYFFTERTSLNIEQYEHGIKMSELFKSYTSGIKTHDDSNLVGFAPFKGFNHPYFFRPFDLRNICYDLTKVQRHRFSVMRHVLNDNLCLLVPRQAITNQYGIFVSKGLTDINYTGTAGQFGAGLTFPLYQYPEETAQLQIGQTTERRPNLNPEIVNQIATGLGLRFKSEKEAGTGTFAPIDILDYIYAVLHSPAYREKYKEFLKIDFPRVPYPKDPATFWKLVHLGSQIRQIHLLESPVVSKYITRYPIDGSNVVAKLKYENGKVFINETQYFEDVPSVAWSFYIGGYQPAQKWLKDRKDRELSFEDILHYQKIIVALTETDRLMKLVDEVGV